MIAVNKEELNKQHTHIEIDIDFTLSELAA